MAKSYAEKLKDKRWLARRDEIFALRGEFCERCNSTYNIQLHHKYYERGLEPWEYPQEAYEVLCRNCHMDLHAARERISRIASIVDARHLNDFCTAVEQFGRQTGRPIDIVFLGLSRSLEQLACRVRRDGIRVV